MQSRFCGQRKHARLGNEDVAARNGERTVLISRNDGVESVVAAAELNKNQDPVAGLAGLRECVEERRATVRPKCESSQEKGENAGRNGALKE